MAVVNIEDKVRARLNAMKQTADATLSSFLMKALNQACEIGNDFAWLHLDNQLQAIERGGIEACDEAYRYSINYGRRAGDCMAKIKEIVRLSRLTCATWKVKKPLNICIHTRPYDPTHKVDRAWPALPKELMQALHDFDRCKFTAAEIATAASSLELMHSYFGHSKDGAWSIGLIVNVYIFLPFGVATRAH